MVSTKSENATVINVTHVTKTYGQGNAAVTALANVTVNFARGSFTAIMGSSGSGKSTLLQCAAGLDRPTSGEITLDGTSLNGLSETEATLLRRDRIGYIFQAFNLIGALTAAQNVALPLRLAGKAPEPHVISQALQQVGLEGRADHLPSQLSGGQQQRVAIARALVTQPAVLFADEPTGALDTNASKEVLSLIRSIVDQAGQTVVMVTHDPVAASRADRVLFLADGKVVDELASPTPKTVIGRMAQIER